MTTEVKLLLCKRFIAEIAIDRYPKRVFKTSKKDIKNIRKILERNGYSLDGLSGYIAREITERDKEIARELLKQII